MLKHVLSLLFLAFVLTNSYEIDATQELSLDDPEPQGSSFLSFDNGEASSFSLDLDLDFSNFTDLFNASAIVDSMQEMVEPIGQGIESVGQQIDDAFAWIEKNYIQDTLDVVWTWVSGDEAQPVQLEIGETTVTVEVVSTTTDEDVADGEMTTRIENMEVTLIAEVEAQNDENQYYERDEIEVIMFQEEAIKVETPVSVPVEIPVSVPIEAIDEIVVLVDYNDIVAAMNIPNATSEAIEKELFNVRFFEVYMGKEIELELKSANLAPVEESQKKSKILSYDAL